MALFHPGQVIVYGNVGVCEVEGVRTMNLTGNISKEYYTLRPFFSQNSDRIYIPIDTGAYTRPVLSAEEAASALETLRTTDVKAFTARSSPLLAAHYQERMQSHALADHLTLYKEICQKEARQKECGRKLNSVDLHFYQQAEQLLSEEFAFSLHETPAEARKTLREAALS